MCGQNARGVDVDGVPAGRLDDRHAGRQQVLAQVLDAPQAVVQVVLVEHLDEALGHRLQVAAGQPAVGDEPFGQDQQVVGPLGERVVAHQQHAADVDQAVLLGADRRAVGQVEHLAGDLADRPILLARLALLDQVGVLGEPAGVEEQRDAVPLADARGPPGGSPG